MIPRDVDMATGSDAPCWPLGSGSRRVTNDFGKPRRGGTRYHVGEDLHAPQGTVVRAMEDGKVVATQPFNGPEAYAILVEHDSGVVVMYGEVFPDSWEEFGVDVGSRVSRCDAIARVGVNPGGSTMLHLETYTAGARRNRRWMVGDDAPLGLRNPTDFLSLAAATPDEREPTAPMPGAGGGAPGILIVAALTAMVAGMLLEFGFGGSSA